MDEKKSSGIATDSLTESDDDSNIPCRRRRSLRSEVSSNELWEGFPLNITIPRLKITRRKSSIGSVAQGSNSDDYACSIQKSPHSTSFPDVSPRKQKPAHSYLLKINELSAPASLLWNSEQRDRPFLDDPNEERDKLEVQILADFNVLNEKEKLPFYVRAAIALDMVGETRDNSAAERKKRKKSVHRSPSQADQTPSKCGESTDTFCSLPTDHQDQFLKYKLARLETFLTVSEYQQFLLDFVLAFREAKLAAMEELPHSGTTPMESISDIARKLLYDKVKYAEETILTKTRYQLIALESHKQKFRQFARKLIREHSLKMGNEGIKYEESSSDGCDGNRGALATGDASSYPTQQLSPASCDHLVDCISGDNNSCLKSIDTVCSESWVNTKVPAVTKDTADCLSGELYTTVNYTNTPDNDLNLKLNSEAAVSNEKSVAAKDVSVKDQVSPSILNSTTFKIGCVNWVVPMITNDSWETGLLKEACRVPELQELEVENVQEWLGHDDTADNGSLFQGAADLSPAVRFRDAFYTDAMERVYTTEKTFQSDTCCLLNSPSCILSGLVSAETATSME